MAQKLVQNVNGNIYVGFVSPMPGNSDIAVSHGVYLMKGDKPSCGTQANLLRISQIRELGYSSILCTVASDNHKQHCILARNGWALVGASLSKRTKTLVHIYLRNL